MYKIQWQLQKTMFVKVCNHAQTDHNGGISCLTSMEMQMYYIFADYMSPKFASRNPYRLCVQLSFVSFCETLETNWDMRKLNYEILKIKILEMDWDVMNPNKMFRTRENISRNFQKLGLALEN